MPVIGAFHAKYWRARANTPPPVLPGGPVMYHEWQSTIQRTVTLTMAIGWVSLDALGPIWQQLRWYWRLARRLWHWRAPANQEQLETWIARLEVFTTAERAVLERVVTAMEGPWWAEAQAAVALCATTPKFHQPEQWVDYGRALKRNPGQAQNVFRHLKAVHALRDLADGPAPISNPDAHLIVELAYQAFAAQGRPERRLVTH